MTEARVLISGVTEANTRGATEARVLMIQPLVLICSYDTSFFLKML